MGSAAHRRTEVVKRLSRTRYPDVVEAAPLEDAVLGKDRSEHGLPMGLNLPENRVGTRTVPSRFRDFRPGERDERWGPEPGPADVR